MSDFRHAMPHPISLTGLGRIRALRSVGRAREPRTGGKVVGEPVLSSFPRFYGLFVVSKLTSGAILAGALTTGR